MAGFLLYLLCLILLAFGCDKSSEEKAVEKQIEKQTGGKADVDLSNKKMKVSGETEVGKYTVTSGEGTEIPEGFPADVFVYRPSKTVMAMEIPEGYSLALTTRDDSAKVFDAYSKEMKAKGWAEEAAMKMESQSVLVYQKDERVVNISIVPYEKEFQISLTVTKE
jgi:hypothetical protein